MLSSIPALPVSNPALSREFYHDKLGLEVTYEEDGFAIVKRDDVEIHLWAATDEKWRERGVRANRPIVSGAESFLAGTASCRIEVEDVDEFYAICRDKNILHPNGDLRDEWYGSREFAVVDPDNNLITFFERKSNGSNG